MALEEDGPSQVDEAINSLAVRITNFEDAKFSAAAMHLSIEELDALIALLIHRWSNDLTEELLFGYLNLVRHDQGGFINCGK